MAKTKKEADEYTVRDIHTPTARLKLPRRPKPHWFTIAPGIALGYRRLGSSRKEAAGSWNVRAADGVGGNWIKSFALANDLEAADEINVLDFSQADRKARELARGTDANATGAPVTLDQALVDYRQDLIANGQPTINESHPRHHLTPALLVRLVSQLTARELKTWRNSLVAKGVKASTINRMCKGLKAALNQAAEHDDRIKNAKAWGGKAGGLAALPEDDDTESNIVLEEEQRHGVVAAAYEISLAFGLYVEVHAATGARSDQIARINVGDLQTGAKPLLMVPPSKKGGKKRKTRIKKPMPISASLARRLKQAAANIALPEGVVVSIPC